MRVDTALRGGAPGRVPMLLVVVVAMAMGAGAQTAVNISEWGGGG